MAAEGAGYRSILIGEALDHRLVTIAAVVALLINALALLVLIKSGSDVPVVMPAAPKVGPVNPCGDRRCAFHEVAKKRRPIDAGPVPELDFIEVAVVPQLGLKPEDPKELPKLVKYEQPEVIEEAINIERENPPPEETPKMEPVPRPPELDKRRKVKSLDDILDAPRDEDPRKRPSKLDQIIGVAEGSVHGSGATGQVDAEIAKIQAEFRKAFTVPANITDAELKTLDVALRIKVKPDGTIESYEIVRSSRNPQYNSAATATMKKFMPKEGGSARLPAISPEIIANINAGKITFRLDGRLLSR